MLDCLLLVICYSGAEVNKCCVSYLTVLLLWKYSCQVAVPSFMPLYVNARTILSAKVGHLIKKRLRLWLRGDISIWSCLVGYFLGV